ncbi:MAG: ATP-binding cassette domain-containing protein [candidate division KSB1 bacterium]|jgi:ABC-type methionine transport system ATPase subunit|nr:ATP-binding cassette domain-containing protein [candidate division KSB1 bacterium]
MIFSLNHVSKFKCCRNANGGEEKRTILRDLCYDSCGDGIQVILGPSGSGKTTLLRLLNRLESPDEGRIFMNGQDISTIVPRELRQKVSMVFQVPALFRGTVKDNLLFGPRLLKRDLPDSVIASLMQSVGLESIETARDVQSLSVGQQQRIALARALANDPDVLLLDEPTSALDPSSSKNLLNMVKKINKELHLSIIIVTHILQHAEYIADTVCLLVNGMIIEHGPADSFFKYPQTDTGRRFISGELEI